LLLSHYPVCWLDLNATDPMEFGLFFNHFCFLQFTKEARQARWRTYAKASLDLCNKYSTWAMNERVNPNNKLIADASPKDIKQLEILKPLSAPSMGRRHKESLEKEKRLEVASRPIQKKASTVKKDKETDDDDGNDDGDAEEPKEKQRRKKNKKQINSGASDGSAMRDNKKKNGLDEADMVEDLNWSDEG
jgi:hypothetical protein